MMAKGSLYLIPAPIGNLSDVSPRVMETLNRVDFLACEDTRKTLKLLQLLNVKKVCLSCHEHNEMVASEKIINRILDGESAGYISDAGYPCISDPGFILASKAIENGITIIPLSGANAALNALVASGINPNHFLFYGFLPVKEGDMIKELNLLREFPYTIIFYESPHRINKTLKTLHQVLGNRKVTLAREISKLHEEFIYSDLSELAHLEKEIIGEIVLVVEGNIASKVEITDEEIIAHVSALTKNGLTKKDAIASTSLLLNINKNRIKTLFLK